MPKAKAGQGSIVTQPGRSKHQRAADTLLVEAGFEFKRRTGQSGNLYHHPDGRHTCVHATPRNPSSALHMLRTLLGNPDVHRERQGIEEEVATTTPDAPLATRLIALAPEMLFKREDNSRHAVAARNSALASWVKRSVERHGPLLASDLAEATTQIGYGNSQLVKARLAAGVVGYVVPGSAKGKGQLPAWVALPHQVPEEASVTGRRTREELKASENGVQPFAGEPEVEATPATETAQSLVDDGWSAGVETQPEPPTPEEIERFHREAAMVDAAFHTSAPIEKVALKPLAPVAGSLTLPEQQSAEISAAAQMLLDSLGLKVMDPTIREQVFALRQELNMLHHAVEKIEEHLTRLVGIVR